MTDKTRYHNCMLASSEYAAPLLLNRKIPRLLIQICRDFYFFDMAGDSKIVRHRPGIWIVSKSICQYLMMRSSKKFFDFALCLNPNLFNYRAYKNLASEIRNVRSAVVFEEVNPFLGAKYLALILALVKIFGKSARRLRYRFYLNANIPRREIVLYYHQLIHYLLSKKVVGSSVYFSSGAPGYARYISERYVEIQHGVLHKNHPICRPIAREKGSYIVLESFNSPYLPLKATSLDDALESFALNMVDRPLENIAFVPLRYEDEFTACIEENCGKSKYLFHPRSVNYRPEKLDEIYNDVRCANKVYVGFSTTIFDVYSINRNALHIMLPKKEAITFSKRASKKEIAKFINDYFSVEINESQIGFY